MKKILILLLLVVSPVLAQTNFIMPMTIVNSDGNKTERAKFGIDPNATTSIDATLGEFEIPALFPTILSGAFVFYDTSLQEEIMSYIDIRPDFQSDKDSVVYHLSIAGIINSFTIKWNNFPAGIKKAIMKSTYLSDKYNWINMLTQDSVNVTNTAVTDFTITVYNYDDGVGVDEKEQQNTEDEFAKLIVFTNEKISFPAGMVKSFELYSVTGELLFSLDHPNDIDGSCFSNLATGVYPMVFNTIYGRKTYTMHRNVGLVK